MPLPVVAPLALASIVIDDDLPATPSGNFHHDAIQKAGHGHPKRDNK
jgi:hypothetical protein